MIRKTLLAGAAFSAACATALAADLPPLKAPARARVTAPYGISGCYFGIAAKGGVDQVSASGSALFATSLATGSLSASGGGVGGDVGCMWGLGAGSFAKWVAVEGDVYWQNITASGMAGTATASVPASYASRWSSDQTVKIGGLDLSWLPTFGFTFPALPPPPTIGGVNLLQPGLMYVSFGVEEWGINGQFFTAGGTTVGIAPLIGAGVINQIADSAGKVTGGTLDTGAQIVFADKGLGISNAFATSGGPVAASLSSGRKYEAYVHYNF